MIARFQTAEQVLPRSSLPPIFNLYAGIMSKGRTMPNKPDMMITEFSNTSRASPSSDWWSIASYITPV